MPPQDRVRRDQRRHLTQDPSPAAVAGRREPAPLGLGQPHMPPCERRVEDAGLFTPVRDHVELVAIHPAGARPETDPPPNRVEHGPSVLGWRSAR